MVTVLFFGATAALAGKRSIEIPISEHTKGEEILRQILDRYPKIAEHRLLFSVNQQYATGKEVLHEGDELAIFTAVSGG